jgi:hypothetical protein
VLLTLFWRSRKGSAAGSITFEGGTVLERSGSS